MMWGSSPLQAKSKESGKNLVEKNIKELIEGLKTEESGIRDMVAEELIDIGDDAVDLLIEALQEKSGWQITYVTSSRVSLSLNDISSFKKTIARILGEIGNPVAVYPLIDTLRDENIGVRNSAAEALVEIGDAAIDPLIALSRDFNREVCNAAIWVLGEIGDVKAIEPLNEAMKNKNTFSSDSISTALEKIILTNRPLLESFPDLICRRCLLRGKIEDINSGIFSSTSYVTCRICGSSLYFINNIKSIIGLIGIDTESFKITEGKAHVTLWYESEKKTKNADIDILEIRESKGSGLNYDWAVNAVLNELMNDVSRPREYVRGISVIIKGKPLLSENSMRILMHEFKEIINE